MKKLILLLLIVPFALKAQGYGHGVGAVAHAGNSSHGQFLYNHAGNPRGLAFFTYDTTLGRVNLSNVYNMAIMSVVANFTLSSISSASAITFPTGGTGDGGITINSSSSGADRRIRFKYNGVTVSQFEPLTTEPRFWLNYNLSIKSDSSAHDIHVGNGPTDSWMDAGDLGFTSSSDSTLKRNRQPISSIIPDAQILNRLQGVRVERWQWDADKIVEQFHPSKVAGWDTLSVRERQERRQEFESAAAARAEQLAQKQKFGPMAQQINEMFGDPDNTRISQDRINAVLMHAVQELTRRVNVLQQRVAALEQGR